MKTMIIVLAMFFGLSVAHAEMTQNVKDPYGVSCDDRYEFGSPEWWECKTNEGR